MSTMKTWIIDDATPSLVFIKKQLQKNDLKNKLYYQQKIKCDIISYQSYLIIGHIAQHYTHVCAK